MAKKRMPNRAQVTVKWAALMAFGSPPEVKYLMPAQVSITKETIKPKPTITEITLEKTLSISCKPAAGIFYGEGEGGLGTTMLVISKPVN